jgi:Holliday junction resolvase
MSKNTKAKGSRNEHRSMKLLEAAGYRCTRNAASLGEWDIVGIGPDGFILCQVKSNRWPVEAEMEALRAFRCPLNCRRLVHRWIDRKQIPDVREI